MVLLDLLIKGGYNVAVAHCNFQLRGADSEQDEQFVEGYASEHGLSYFNKSFDTQKIATDQQISIQMAARELRYEWFFDLLSSHGFDYLLTAHHLNDSAETLLINLTRGSSIHGLKGIDFKNERVRRPLSSFHKKELKSYAEACGIRWREDSSNQEDKYVRNAIRHRVIPELESLNPSFLKQIEQLSEKNKAVEKIWNTHIASFEQRYVKRVGHEVSIVKAPFGSGEVGPFELYELIHSFGFKYDQCQSIVASLAHVGAQFKSLDYTLFIGREDLTLQPDINEKEKSLVISDNECQVSFGHMNWQIDLKNKPSQLDDDSAEYFSPDRIAFPLLVRKWQHGDKMRPLGMKGKKLISDILIDKKVEMSDKSEVYVMLSAGEICWLIGYQISDDFKVKESDQKVLAIHNI